MPLMRKAFDKATGPLSVTVGKVRRLANRHLHCFERSEHCGIQLASREVEPHVVSNTWMKQRLRECDCAYISIEIGLIGDLGHPSP